jgi:hypothetical protein
MFFLLQNQRTGRWNMFYPGAGDLALVGGVGSGEKYRRVNIMQIMYTHVCKCKNDTC